MTKRRLPTWLADGPEVSDLAYRVVVHALDGWRRAGVEITGAVSVVDVVNYLAVELDADEADVLRAFAELERVGALTTRQVTVGINRERNQP